MFFGHIGVAFAAKPVAPKVPLGALLVATEAIDLLCFGFFATGIERQGATQVDLNQGLQVLTSGSMPWSHGLFMAIVWSIMAAALAFAFTRDRRAAGVVGLVVFSHWALDFVVHPPDLPLLFGGSPTVGLGLYTSGPGLMASIVLEFALLAGGIATYLVTRRRAATQVR